MNPSTLAALAAFPQQLEDFYQAVPEGYQRWVPSSWEGIPSEAYNAIGQICHVRDIEIDGYHLRFERTLREDKPVLASLDGDAMAAARNYQGASASEVLATFAAARSKTLQIISSLSAASFCEQLELACDRMVAPDALLKFDAANVRRDRAAVRAVEPAVRPPDE